MTDLGFDGKVAIITGAGGGLGRQHALLMAKRGALIVVNDLGGAVDGTGSDKGAAQHVVDEIKAAGGEAVANTDSVATPEGGAAIVQSAVDAFGKVDIVINNAGILRDKAFHNMDADLFDPVFAVHLKGAFNVTQPAWKIMREQGYGRIVSTSSAAGIFGNFGQANYGAAKMGLVGFTNVLAVEGAKFNIKANAIAPLALTRMTEDILGGLGEKLQPELISPLVDLPRPRGLRGDRPGVLGRRRPCRRGVHRRDGRLHQHRPASPPRTSPPTGTPSRRRTATPCRQRSPTRRRCSSTPCADRPARARRRTPRDPPAGRRVAAATVPPARGGEHTGEAAGVVIQIARRPATFEHCLDRGGRDEERVRARRSLDVEPGA